MNLNQKRFSTVSGLENAVGPGVFPVPPGHFHYAQPDTITARQCKYRCGATPAPQIKLESSNSQDRSMAEPASHELIGTDCRSGAKDGNPQAKSTGLTLPGWANR